MLAGGVPPGSHNPDLISDKKSVIFRTRFQIWPLKSIPVFRPGGDHKTQHKYWHETEIMSSSATKRFLKIHFEFAYYTFFLIQLEFWNDEHIDTPPQFLRKPYPIPDQNEQSVYPIPDQNEQSVYPFSDQNRAKTLPDGAAHAYTASIREYPPGEKHTKKPPARQGTKSNSCLIG